MKADPIIAVKNVLISSQWYQSLLQCKSKHGGDQFDILVSEDQEVLLCLHAWGEHEHPTMQDPSIIPGNGLILYFRTDRMEDIRKTAEELNYTIAEEIHFNSNSMRQEFSLRDPDGYYVTITESHEYEG